MGYGWYNPKEFDMPLLTAAALKFGTEHPTIKRVHIEVVRIERIVRCTWMSWDSGKMYVEYTFDELTGA